MGNWKLEIFKMGIYMMFPVGMFYFFNQPQYFEEWVVKAKRELYPPENVDQRIEMKEVIKDHKKVYEDKLKAEFKRLHGTSS